MLASAPCLAALTDPLTKSGQNARPAVAVLVDKFGPIDESTVWEILKRPSGSFPTKAVNDQQQALF